MRGIYMNIKKCKWLILCGTIACFLFGIVCIKPVEVEAKTSLKKTAIELYPNMTKQVKLKGAKGKVKWSVSNTKLVSILGTKGSKNQTITIRTKEKRGKCTLKAVVDDKTYIYTIKVKNDKKVSRAKLVKCMKTSDFVSVKIKLNNKSEDCIEFGKDFYVEKYSNGKWKKVIYADEMTFDSIAMIIPSNSSITNEYIIARGDRVAEIAKGLYRLYVDVYENDAYNYVLFTIK